MIIKVLIVDDEKLERVLLRKGFDWEKKGFEIIGEVASAREALEFVRHRKPELVLTDISMPEMDGLELSEKILQLMPECHIVIVTGYREFEYARKAVQIGAEDFLLKPVDMKDLENITEKIREKIEKEKEHFQEVEQLKKSILADKDIVMESFFQRLVELKIGEEEAVQKLMVYDCERLLKHCVCMNIELNEEVQSSERQKKIRRILSLIRAEEYEDTVCFVHYMGNIILYFLEEDPDKVKEIAVRLQMIIQSELGFPNTIGISSVNFGYAGIAEAYAQTKNALGVSILLGRNKVISYEDYEKIQIQNPTKKEIEWDDFVFSVQNCLAEKVDDYISEYIGQMKVSKPADKEYLGLMCMNMLSKAGVTLNKYGQSMTMLLGGENIYNELRKIATIDDAEAYLRFSLQMIMEYLESRKTRQGNKVVEEALAYINDNIFDPDLSLKLVASKIYTNESYLSRIFKKETGVTLIEYISKKRIDESVRLLNSTDLKVYEIAEKIGFRDPHYFSICFKKQTGMTIKQFKNGGYNSLK